MLVSRIVNCGTASPDAGRTGIGLENVRKRLDLIYGPRLRARIDDSDPATYTVQLSKSLRSMLRCIAIDDEPLALRQVRSYIEKIPYLELAGACDNALDAQAVSLPRIPSI